MLKFEWDEKKNVLNFNKHDVWFEETETVFDDPFEKTEEDYSDPNEERFRITGMSVHNKPLVVIFTIRNDAIRLISARPPLPHEWRKYEQRPKQKRRKAHS